MSNELVCLSHVGDGPVCGFQYGCALPSTSVDGLTTGVSFNLRFSCSDFDNTNDFGWECCRKLLSFPQIVSVILKTGCFVLMASACLDMERFQASPFNSNQGIALCEEDT